MKKKPQDEKTRLVLGIRDQWVHEALRLGIDTQDAVLSNTKTLATADISLEDRLGEGHRSIFVCRYRWRAGGGILLPTIMIWLYKWRPYGPLTMTPTLTPYRLGIAPDAGFLHFSRAFRWLWGTLTEVALERWALFENLGRPTPMTTALWGDIVRRANSLRNPYGGQRWGLRSRMRIEIDQFREGSGPWKINTFDFYEKVWTPAMISRQSKSPFQWTNVLFQSAALDIFYRYFHIGREMGMMATRRWARHKKAGT